MKTQYAISLAALMLLLGFAAGRTREAKANHAEQLQKPVTVSEVRWHPPGSQYKTGTVLFAKYNGREYRSGLAEESDKSTVHIHGEIDGNPFLSIVKFED